LTHRDKGLTVELATARHFSKTIHGCFNKAAFKRYGLKQEHKTAVASMVVSLARTHPNKLGVAVLTDKNGEFIAFENPKALTTNAWRAVNHYAGAVYTEFPDRETSIKGTPMNKKQTKKQQLRQTEAAANKMSGGGS